MANQPHHADARQPVDRSAAHRAVQLPMAHAPRLASRYRAGGTRDEYAHQSRTTARRQRGAGNGGTVTTMHQQKCQRNHARVTGQSRKSYRSGHRNQQRDHYQYCDSRTVRCAAAARRDRAEKRGGDHRARFFGGDADGGPSRQAYGVNMNLIRHQAPAFACTPAAITLGVYGARHDPTNLIS